ncbi:Protein-L-isoaspartate(D-aspartate) O-methyltransferase [Cooperia oncophora]
MEKHAAALEHLKNHLVDGAYALDVGSGSGYLTVCMALMIGSNGKVVGIEHIPELVALAKKNTEKHHADLISSGRVLFVEVSSMFQTTYQNSFFTVLHFTNSSASMTKW